MSESGRDVDVVVIGMGPGGEHAAGTLAECGLAVAGVEGRLVGGECPYWGCVPSKMMIRAADLITDQPALHAGHRQAGLCQGARSVLATWSHADDDNIDVSPDLAHVPSPGGINPAPQGTAAGNVSGGK